MVYPIPELLIVCVSLLIVSCVKSMKIDKQLDIIIAGQEARRLESLKLTEK